MFSALAWSSGGAGQRIAIVKADQQRPANGAGLVNRAVMIDGKRYHCTAVDRDVKTGSILPGERLYLWVRG